MGGVDVLVSRESVIALAIVGGLISLAVMILRATGRVGPEVTNGLNRTAYGFMLASVAVFIVAGFLG